jgi:photosynthetic reaction center H subunit
MLASIGPGSYSDRSDVPDTTSEGGLKLVPMRDASEVSIPSGDPDPRGLPVVGADGAVGGTVRDLWVDRSELVFRYLEVEVPVTGGTRTVLLPMNFTRISSAQVKVRSILGAQFAQVPTTRSPNAVTLLEEDKIVAYYGGGTLYATPQRQEPLL